MNQRRGVRWSAASAFLKPALKRPNLTLWTKAQVLRLVVDGSRVTGIDVKHEGRTKLIRAGREIILSCLGKQGFLTGYTAHLPLTADGTQPTAEAAMTDLTENLKKAGITAETGLRSIAA